MKIKLIRMGSMAFMLSLLILSGCGGGSPLKTSPTTTPTYFAYVPNFDDNTVSIFKLNNDGSLTPIHEPVTTGTNPIRALATRDGKYLYVSNFNDSGLSCYRVCTDGSLAALAEGLVPVSNSAQYIRLNPAGNRIYTVSMNSNVVAVFDIGSDGTLSQVGSNIAAGAGAADIAFTPDGNYAYVSNTGADDLWLYSVSTDGILAVGLDFPAGDTPTCLAIHPNGSYLYALNCNPGTVTAFKVTKEDGTLTLNGSVSVGGYPEDMIITPDGQYVYTANFGNDEVSALKVNDNGSLTLLNSYPTGNGPMGLTPDPTNHLLYVTNRDDNNISVFKIQNDGTLAETNITITTGKSPYGLVFVKAQ